MILTLSGVDVKFHSSYNVIRCITLLLSFCFFPKFEVIHWWFIHIIEYYFLSHSGQRWKQNYLKPSTSRFLLLHKTGNAAPPRHVPSIETSNSQKDEHPENTAYEIRVSFQLLDFFRTMRLHIVMLQNQSIMYFFIVRLKCINCDR